MRSIIVAMDSENGIGKGGRMPWQIREEMAHFRATTINHSIVMGRKTFESIGKPLTNRRNIVISRDTKYQSDPGVIVASSLDEALELADYPGKDTFVIGGGEIYKQAMPLVDQLIVSHIYNHYHCDTKFPEIDRAEWNLAIVQPYYFGDVATYRRKP